MIARHQWATAGLTLALVGLAILFVAILTGCGSQTACQPLYRNGQKVCRVTTGQGHVIFIPWVHYVPKTYVPDNPDHGYNPEPVHVNPIDPVHVDPIVVDPVVHG